MIIEWHNHVVSPEELRDPAWEGRCRMSFDTVLREQEEHDIGLSVVTNSIHPLAKMSDAKALDYLKAWNDQAAEAQQRHKGRLACFSSTIPGGGDAFMKELERAFDELKLKGVYINSSHKSGYPDDAAAAPFWEIVAKRDLPVTMHPPSAAFGEERMREFRLMSSIGRPFDCTLAIGRLILYGLFERHPKVKLVATHAGGGICEVIGRLDYNWELERMNAMPQQGTASPVPNRPSHYLKMMYLDLCTYHAPAARCAIDTVGIDHVLYGSDSPPLPFKARVIRMIRELPMSDPDREKIFSANALKLLNMKRADIQ
jgi:aminocarboxymuconate-semialdehyde decarboxylase